jgi:signal peptidase I
MPATHLQRLAEYRNLALFLGLMFVFRSAWADWMVVPTGSMNPTIIEGDRVLVDKHAFGLRVPFTRTHLTRGEDPARGDIVVFDSPADGTTLIKRVAAIPGDTIALDGERLIVNGVTARYAAADGSAIAGLPARTRAAAPLALLESGLTAPHRILLLPGRSAPSTMAPVTVPGGMYFMLGDNRDNSADSRYIGLVPRERIVGRARRVVLSLDPDDYYLPRLSRTLRALD